MDIQTNKWTDRAIPKFPLKLCSEGARRVKSKYLEHQASNPNVPKGNDSTDL